MDRPTEELGAMYQTSVETYLRHVPDRRGRCSCSRPGCQARCHAAIVIEAAGVDPHSLDGNDAAQHDGLNVHGPQDPTMPITSLRLPPLRGYEIAVGIARVHAERQGRLYPSQDPYLLRHLIRCAEHDLGMTCSLPLRDIVNRVYRCPVRDCWPGTVHAAGIEEMAWKAAEKRATLRGIQPEFRQAALEALLNRVIVGGDPKVRYTWRI